MALVSLGDMAQSFMLRRQNLALKSDMQTLALEMTTGRHSDMTKENGGDYSPLSALDATLSRLKAFGSVTTEAALFSQTMQTALSTIDGLASEASVSLLRAADAAQVAAVNSLGTDARQKFETVVSALNTRVGNRTLFAGQATDRPATVDAETILSALDTATVGALTALDVETAVDTWFSDPLGYAATAYLGAGPLAPIHIAPGDTTQIGITAMDPVLRDTLKGLAMAALLDRGTLSGADAARSDLARRAGESLLRGQTDRAYLAADLGMSEGQIESAKSRNEAESSALQIARAGIVAVDPYETATKLEAAQTQLETLYTITARMSRLSLVDFLR